VASDLVINRLGDSCEASHSLIQPKQGTFPGYEGKQLEHGMSTAKCFPAREDELDSGGELLPGNVREAITYFLIGHVKYPIRHLLPIFNPDTTK
jgi:hypothetical protein